VLGAAVIDVIADAYALPWRGCDIELKQQGVNIGGCALNIAIALKRLGITAQNALPVGHGVWADIIRNAMAKQDLHSAVEAETGDNGWCLALVEPDGNARLCRSAAWKTSGSSPGWMRSTYRPQPGVFVRLPAGVTLRRAAHDWLEGCRT
jgi:sugar/nucleoside kinase (ribokinase family)